MEDIIHKASFGVSGLGMPSKGINTGMKEKDFIDFQNRFLTPNKTIISAANIDDHRGFVSLIENKLA